MKIGMVGLGKMGGNMATRLIEKGHEVVGIDPTPENAAKAGQRGVVMATDRKQVLDLLTTPAIVWLMIPSQLVANELAVWLELLPSGSILVDGGNTRFEQSIKHGELAAKKRVLFLDIGVSGGVLGATNGYSMMVGGEPAGFAAIQPVLEALAQPGGYGHFGASGAGHFVKMVHNAVEYGVMESFAEGYELMEKGPFPETDYAKLASVWQNGSLLSGFLNALAVPIFQANRKLDGVEGKVNMLGEAQWAAELAKAQDIDFRAIDASIARRAESMAGNVSFGTKFLAALRNQFGGHALNKTSEDIGPNNLKNV